MDSVIRGQLHVGYTFMFKGEHCVITKLNRTGFNYSTSSRPKGNFMNYWFFKTIPHYQSRFNKNPKPKSICISEETFNSLYKSLVYLILEKNKF